MLQEDWFMRQIKDMINFLISVILHKKTANYEISIGQNTAAADTLYRQLSELIEELKINEAENLLFENINAGSLRYLELAVDFYSRLNDLDDETLEKCGFSRREIEEGLKDSAKLFGVPVL
ncbi:MAG: DUF6483 family protein [Clostridia bacterium]|nr:DUF6483 family protein [Clostridia bacterium]